MIAKIKVKDFIDFLHMLIEPLREFFWNYFIDTDVFLDHIRIIIGFQNGKWMNFLDMWKNSIG